MNDILKEMATCDYCWYSIDEMIEYFKRALINEKEEGE